MECKWDRPVIRERSRIGQAFTKREVSKLNNQWHPQTEQYANECCDMTDRKRVIGLLYAYSARQKEGQLAVLLHNAAQMLELSYDSAYIQTALTRDAEQSQ